jgi:hypothetical protein
VDVYLPGPGAQIHDLNPTHFPPVGLFWTIQISGDDSNHNGQNEGSQKEGDQNEDDQHGDGENGVDVNLGTGSALLEVSNAPILDYGTIGNALFGGGPPPVPGTVSFKVDWHGVNQRLNIRNTDPVFGGFAGEFVRNAAQMQWTAKVGDFLFESDALGTSSSSFAEIGHERNGVFFS